MCSREVFCIFVKLDVVHLHISTFVRGRTVCICIATQLGFKSSIVWLQVPYSTRLFDSPTVVRFELFHKNSWDSNCGNQLQSSQKWDGKKSPLGPIFIADSPTCIYYTPFAARFHFCKSLFKKFLFWENFSHFIVALHCFLLQKMHEKALK